MRDHVSSPSSLARDKLQEAIDEATAAGSDAVLVGSKTAALEEAKETRAAARAERAARRTEELAKPPPLELDAAALQAAFECAEREGVGEREASTFEEGRARLERAYRKQAEAGLEPLVQPIREEVRLNQWEMIQARAT